MANERNLIPFTSDQSREEAAKKQYDDITKKDETKK